MMQTLHRDLETTLPETDYFVLGNGLLQVVVQWSRFAGATPLGLLLSEPEHFARKWSTHLFHPEYGLSRTMPALLVDGIRYVPQHETTTVRWMDDPREGIIALWQAGALTVKERLWVPEHEPTLVREFSIESDRDVGRTELELALYANPALYSRFGVTASGLHASGLRSLQLTSTTVPVTSERTMRLPLSDETGENELAVLYSITEEPPSPDLASARRIGRDSWRQTGGSWEAEAVESSLAGRIARTFATSAVGLRGVISERGRFDASVFQYGFEWSGDAAMVCEALIYSGQFELAGSVLKNILVELTNDAGMARESGRFRGGADAELNNNGEILKACRTYLDWTGDAGLIEEHYLRIRAIAEYLISPEFLDRETGMLVAARDIWERSAAVGIRPGFDIAHQSFAIIGLGDAAEIARRFGFSDDALRWSAASSRMRESFLGHPTHSMIAEGRVIKRRLLDGSIQRSLAVGSDTEFLKHFVPSGMPLAEGGPKAWEPDVSQAFPICLGIVEPGSDVARATIEQLDLLWSQAWEGGGYGRYNVESEPDSPGPWPFATAFMAEAAFEVGDEARATRALEWLIDRAGAGGSWLEFYGHRPTPPLPPTGIIVWGWAQFITLVVKHILCARVHAHDQEARLSVAPRLECGRWVFRFRESTEAYG